MPSTPTSPSPAGHAVVIGGSLAGLLAARALADYFERVTVLERDRYPDTPLPRKGLPQARHVHVLLVRGRQVLDDFFPGLSEELESAGALRFDVARDLGWLTPAGWGLRFMSGLEMLGASRDLLDQTVRRRLLPLPQVHFRENVDVTGLLPGPEDSGVGGVVLHDREAEVEERLGAELVVDAGGRGSRLPQWLRALGYPAPAETVVDAHVVYASRLYRLAHPLPDDWKALALQPTPPQQNRSGVALPIEGGRLMVSLAGPGAEQPPTDEAGFLEFARNLQSPLLYEVIKEAEPLTPIVSSSATANRLRHCERLANWPERLTALGDAVCALNPVYAQGMTTAAVGAALLGRLVGEQRRRTGSLAGFGLMFQKELARVNATPWTLATSEDVYYPDVVGGQRTASTERMHWFLTQVLRLSTQQQDVRMRFLEVFHMLQPPSALVHPAVLAAASRPV